MQASAAACALTYLTLLNGRHLNGRRFDRRQVEASYISYACLLPVQLHVHLDVHDLGL
jgi:hypothetical protein